MAEINGGYILLARKILDSDLMNKPPLWSKLWVWLLCRARQRDGNTRKVGEVFTTIDEMREAMSWRVGFRVEKPSKDEIRKAYEGYVKATMATTVKTTRGIIITVLNFEKYQDPKNYEAHTEDHNESVRRPYEAHTIRQEVQEGVKKNKILCPKPPVSGQREQEFYLTKKGRRLEGKRLETFNQLWEAYGYKKGKPAAADAWLQAKGLTDKVFATILEAAKAYGAEIPNILARNSTPKMLQGWITDRRWEDEAGDLQGTGKSTIIDWSGSCMEGHAQ